MLLHLLPVLKALFAHACKAEGSNLALPSKSAAHSCLLEPLRESLVGACDSQTCQAAVCIGYQALAASCICKVQAAPEQLLGALAADTDLLKALKGGLVGTAGGNVCPYKEQCHQSVHHGLHLRASELWTGGPPTYASDASQFQILGLACPQSTMQTCLKIGQMRRLYGPRVIGEHAGAPEVILYIET